MTDYPARYREILEMCEKATPGPWSWDTRGCLGRFTVLHQETIFDPHNVSGGMPDDRGAGPLSKENFRKWWKEVLGSYGKTCEDEAPYNAALIAACDPATVRHLVERAAALDALEEWLRGSEFRFAKISEVVGEDEMAVRLDHLEPDNEETIAHEKGDTLAQAIQAALSKADYARKMEPEAKRG